MCNIVKANTDNSTKKENLNASLTNTAYTKALGNASYTNNSYLNLISIVVDF